LGGRRRRHISASAIGIQEFARNLSLGGSLISNECIAITTCFPLFSFESQFHKNFLRFEQHGVLGCNAL
jgi:hypothetical protein